MTTKITPVNEQALEDSSREQNTFVSFSLEAIMNFRLRRGFSPRRRTFELDWQFTPLLALMPLPHRARTTATGALAGELLDPTGAVILARLPPCQPEHKQNVDCNIQ